MNITNNLDNLWDIINKYLKYYYNFKIYRNIQEFYKKDKQI